MIKNVLILETLASARTSYLMLKKRKFFRTSFQSNLIINSKVPLELKRLSETLQEREFYSVFKQNREKISCN